MAEVVDAFPECLVSAGAEVVLELHHVLNLSSHNSPVLIRNLEIFQDTSHHLTRTVARLWELDVEIVDETKSMLSLANVSQYIAHLTDSSCTSESLEIGYLDCLNDI